MTGQDEAFGPGSAVTGPSHQTQSRKTCRDKRHALGDGAGRTVGMSGVILTFFARYAEVSKRTAEGEIGSDLRVGQARIGLDGAMPEGHEHQRQCAKH
jgi:hypothetical protein